MPLYNIKRGETIVATIWPEGNQDKEIMLKDEVPISFKSPAALYFQIGDTIRVYGETYYLNALDEPTKDSTLSYRYQMNFVASYYALAKPKIFFYDSANALKVIKFEVMITPRQLLDLIVANANRTQTGWVAGDCIDAPPKLLTFNGESLLTALDTGAKEFETEWWVKNKVMHLTKKGAVSGYHFEYGYDKGLRGGLSRTNVDSSSVFSRLYVTGSDQNLPVGYRNGQTNLQLPADTEYIQGPKYGDDEIEAVINFDDIKPERIGTISSVTSPFVFSDSGIDFDLNEPGRLLPGVSVKVSFLTGNLAGYNFEVAKGGYNHATRTITILKNDVEKSLQLPSDLMKPAVGDTYFFFDLVMPASYVTDAEHRVKVRGQEYFNKQSVPRVAYDLPPDPFYFARNNIVLAIGDYVNVKDTELLLDKDIRVYSYSRDLHDGFKYDNLKVSDMPIGSSYIRQIAAAEKVTKALNIAQINNIQRSRQNWKNSQELLNKYFDPGSEQIYTEAISPVTLRALMIQTGDTSQQLVLVGLNFTSNYQQDVNKINWTSGRLVHTTIAPDPVTWNIPGATVAGLDPAKVYYIYAKCNRTNADGSILVSDVQIKVDQDPEFYHFWIGLANSVIDNYRNLKSVYGSVSIYGRTIEGGIIVGNQLEINLDEGTVQGKIQMLDGSYTEGLLNVGSDGQGNAFISGVTNEGDQSIRFGAGGQLGDNNLPFRVLDDGSVFMSKATISGNITIGTESGNTSDGYTAGWKLSEGAILSDGTTYPGLPGGNNFALIRGSSRYAGDKYNEFAFGTDLIPGSAGGAYSQIAYIKNKRPKAGSTLGLDDTTNIGLELAADGANFNTALYISSGDVQVKEGTKIYKGINGVINLSGSAGTSPGQTGFLAIRVIKGAVVEYGYYNISTGIIT